MVVDSAAVLASLDQNDALPRAADAAIRKLLVANRFFASLVTCEFLTGVRLQHDDEEVVRGSSTTSSRSCRRDRHRQRITRLRADRKSRPMASP